MERIIERARLTPAELAEPKFWEAQFPELSLSAPIDAARYAAEMGYDEARRGRDAERMAEDGYTHGSHPLLKSLAPTMAEAVRKCMDLGLPPVFLFLFSETWRCFFALRPFIAPILGANFCALPDFWVWHVDPKGGEAGWTPHVDKGTMALDRFGRPLSLTLWIALSKATPLNSCIYLLPASRDTGYHDPTQRTWDLAQLRALPGEPGDFFCWNQNVLHWGSASSRFAEEPRISMALEFQTAAVPPFREPLIADPEQLNFEAKLQLIAKQILQYRHMYAVDPAVEALATALRGGS